MSKTPLLVLCFGDSLTGGFHTFGFGMNPYSGTLRLRLESALPGTPISLVTNGVSGQRATATLFQERLKEACRVAFVAELLSTKDESSSYDWTIILGGTNDLAVDLSSESIFAALKASWAIALSHGSKVLVLTVPECHAVSETLDNTRRDLNNRIMSSSEPPNLYAFDLFAKIPYHSLPKQDHVLYWDDGVHLTVDGYKWMGNHVADALLSIISSNGSLTRTM